MFSIVASYLPIPSLLHCGQTCHLANILVRQEIRFKLSQFLAAYFDPLSGAEALEVNCAYVVGQSAYTFFNTQENVAGEEEILYISCPSDRLTPFISQLLQPSIGYRTCPSLPSKSTYLLLNPYIRQTVTLARRNRFIVFTTVRNDNAVLASLGQPSTAFMSLVSPSYIWCAYPKWTFHSLSVWNPSYDERFVSLSILHRIRRAHSAIVDAGLTNISVPPRALDEFADVNEVLTENHAHEGLRSSSDGRSLSFRLSVAGRTIGEVIWRFNGELFDNINKQGTSFAIDLPSSAMRIQGM